MLKRTLIRFAPLACAITGCASAQQTYQVTVPATANIFAAGQVSAFSGTLPPVVHFPQKFAAGAPDGN